MTSMEATLAPQHVAQPAPETMFSFSRVGDVAVVTLACPAVREWQASVLSSYLSDVVDQHRGRSVVVDVAGIAQFSCAWLNALIQLSTHCESMGGHLVVAGLSRQSRRMLRASGLHKHLRQTGTTQEALTHLGQDDSVAPWRMAVARLLDIPVSHKAKQPRAA